MKNILITGCSSGIGYYSAKALKAKSFNVLATVRNVTDKARLENEGLDVILMDMQKEASIEQGFDEAMTYFDGKLDALFNNAGFGQCGAIEDLPTDALRNQFETNVFGVHTLTRKALPVMHNQGHGRIIQHSSVLGFAALSFRGAYNASKFALEGLTDTLRLELIDSPIHVSLIEPGPVESQFRANALKAFKAEIDVENSRYKAEYTKQIERLEAEKSLKGAEGPEAVFDKLWHALTSNKPKARYYVCKQTHLIAWLKRFLPTRIIDRILARNA
ncbi:MAG: SDR family NAD(P)-dependent oxidoreductase [Cellvibrionales bacterium]|nr:SDR family NAD(P)-dependent oxidoreductase [Cellvibrionales bacterium]